jgi:hypothetical protein
MAIDSFERLQDFIDLDDLAVFEPAHGGHIGDGVSVRSPRGQYGALFGDRELSVGQDIMDCAGFRPARRSLGR